MTKFELRHITLEWLVSFASLFVSINHPSIFNEWINRLTERIDLAVSVIRSNNIIPRHKSCDHTVSWTCGHLPSVISPEDQRSPANSFTDSGFSGDDCGFDSV